MVGKLALVTGAAVRVGAAFATHLAARGYDLIVHSHTTPPDATIAACRQAGALVDSIQANLSDPQSLQDFCQAVTQRGQAIDLLVNNAAVFPDATADLPQLQHCFAVNLFAPLLLIEKLTFADPALVVNLIDSRAGRRTKPRLGYSLSKVALAEATRQLAVTLAPHTRVNGICPGPVLPPPEMGDSQQGMDYLQSVITATPLQQRIGLTDLTCALDYLIDSGRVTGQLIFVDSGEHLH